MILKSMVESLTGPIIIAIVSASGIAATLLFNIRASNRLANANFLTLFNEYTKEHTRLIKEESNLKNTEDTVLHAITYFDLLNNIAYLCLKKYVKPEMGLSFTGYFEYVQLMMKWYDDTIGWDSVLTKKRWPSIGIWCDINKIESDTNYYYLPEAMQKIHDAFNDPEAIIAKWSGGFTFNDSIQLIRDAVKRLKDLKELEYDEKHIMSDAEKDEAHKIHEVIGMFYNGLDEKIN